MKTLLPFLAFLASVIPAFAAGPYYVSSVVGSDANAGTTWATALRTLTNAINIVANAAGDTIYVDPIHSESNSTAIALTSLGTAAGPINVFCAADTNANPPASLGTGAVLKTAAVSTVFSINGFFIFKGLSLYGANLNSVSSGFSFLSGTAPGAVIMDNCSLNMQNTAACIIRFGNNGNGSEDDQVVVFRNTAISFSAVGQSITVMCPVGWRAVTVAGTAPTSLFLPIVNNPWGNLDAMGCDFSLLGSGKNIVNVGIANASRFTFTDCRLGSSVSRTTGNVIGQGGTVAKFINCNATNVNYAYFLQSYQGNVQEATDTFVNSGASDGQTSFSRKMTTTANTKYYSPLVSDPIHYWNDVTNSAVTVTVPFITDGVTLSNHQVWIEASFLAAATNTLGYFTNTCTIDILAAGAALASDSTTTWTTNGLGVAAPVKQTASLTVAPKMRGLISVTVNSALPSTNFWFGPKLQIQ